jgi:hypothetical protein
MGTILPTLKLPFNFCRKTTSHFIPYWNSTNSMEQRYSSGADSRSPGQEIRHFYKTRRFISVLTRARHWTLSWARWIQSARSRTLLIKWILILPSDLRLGLPNNFFHLGVTNNTLHAVFIAPRVHLIHQMRVQNNRINNCWKQLKILYKQLVAIWRLITKPLCHLFKPTVW